MTASDGTRRVRIVEVGLRDGLQIEPRTVATADKARLARALVAAGIRDFEIASFVSPRAVPQMADAEDLLAALRDLGPEVELTALVPNRRGAERAVAAGVGGMVVFASASESHNAKNLNRSIDGSLAAFAEVAALGRQAGVPVHGAIATAFGCPFEGEVPVAGVVRVARAYADLGIRRIALGDTTGMATPPLVRQRVEALRSALPDVEIALHFHNTRGIGLANVMEGLALGVDRYESSIGGLGGCPFVPAATGNIATEDLAYLLAECGCDTGVDLDRLIEAERLAESIVGRTLPGQVSKAGPRLRRYALDDARTAAG